MPAARGRRKIKEDEAPFRLPENFVPPSMTLAAVPEWANAISTELLKQTALKGSPGFDPGPEQAEQIERLTALGLTSTDIAAVLRIEPKLLEKYYKYEIETADKRTNAEVAKIALSMALSGAEPDMTKFWLKTRAGWKETKEVQMTGQGGGPIQFQEVKQRMLDAIEAEITDIEYDDK